MKLSKKIILITGAGGFIGKNLVKKISLLNFQIFLVDKSKSEFFDKNLTFIKADLSNFESINKIIKKKSPNIVVHLGSSNPRTNVNLPNQNSNDLLIAKNLIDCCSTILKFQKFIFLGSCAEYGDTNGKIFKENIVCKPKDLYGKSKLSITNYLIYKNLINKFPYIVLRPSVVYGPNQPTGMFISDMVNKLNKREILQIKSGKQQRDFIFIDDLIKAIIKTVKLPINQCNHIINISYGKSYQLNSIIKIFYKINKIKNNDIVKRKILKNEKIIYTYKVSNLKAKKILNWSPKISIYKGLKELV